MTVDPQSVKGFLSPAEGEALTRAARDFGHLGPVVELGAYCGRSTLYLAYGARAAGARVFSVDHHRGSEEHQPGWAYHDPALWDEGAGALDTLPTFRRNIRAAGVEDVVIACIGSARAAAEMLTAAPGLLFIDGGHSRAAALSDWRAWGPRVAVGGVLAIHDVFPDPRDGGRPPTEIYQLARASGLYDPTGWVGTLGLLKRVG